MAQEFNILFEGGAGAQDVFEAGEFPIGSQTVLEDAVNPPVAHPGLDPLGFLADVSIIKAEGTTHYSLDAIHKDLFVQPEVQEELLTMFKDLAESVKTDLTQKQIEELYFNIKYNADSKKADFLCSDDSVEIEGFDASSEKFVQTIVAAFEKISLIPNFEISIQANKVKEGKVQA